MANRWQLAWRGALVLWAVPFLCGADAAVGPRDDWQHLRPFILEQVLEYSLANAPLSAAERAQIYRVIDDKTIHDSFTDQQHAEERDTVLSARVGWIALAEAGSRQLLVQGPRQFCGATGNCSLWIFVRERGRLRLALQGGGGVLVVRKTSSRGFHDIATGWHMSAAEEDYSVYRWDGAQYRGADCYIATFDPMSPSASDAPAITDCSK